MDMRPTRAANLGGVLVGLTCLGTAGVLTYPLWRTWCLTWGATADEVDSSLPGDDLLTDPDVITTRAIHIDVPPARMWPWLVQMGPGRAGAYTYDWIENLAGLNMHSADEIIPEYQDLERRRRLESSAREDRVLRGRVDSSRDTALVLRSDDGNWVWAFVLVPAGRDPPASAATASANRAHRWPGR